MCGCSAADGPGVWMFTRGELRVKWNEGEAPGRNEKEAEHLTGPVPGRVGARSVTGL